MKRLLSFLFVIILAMGITGCTQTATTDLMQNISPRIEEVFPDMQAGGSAATDFSVRLLQTGMEKEKNTLISPLSVYYALAMTANGTAGETLDQMEQLLGMEVADLNVYMLAYLNRLPEGQNYKVSMANSIWFRDDPNFVVEQSFLQTNADHYGAGIYKAPFDETTRKNINNWVKEHTDGMIPNILEGIPREAVMYLINALSFDARWDKEYKDHQIWEGSFTTEEGVRQNVEMMHSQEHTYLEDGMAAGFVRYYKDRKYAFVALLPNEGIPLSQYVQSLTGESLRYMIQNAQNVTVSTAIPKFETEYQVDMADVLQKMGMTAAFDWRVADFSRLGSYNVEGMNLFINRVLHKTHISVSEQGTQAGAATVVEIAPGSAAPMEEIKEVVLDRPFLYMIIDCENQFPIFMGTMMTVNGQ